MNYIFVLIHLLVHCRILNLDVEHLWFVVNNQLGLSLPTALSFTSCTQSA